MNEIMNDADISCLERVITGFELAHHLTITPSRVSQLTKAEVLHKTRSGYKMIDNIQAYIKHLLKYSLDPFDPQLSIEKARICRIKCLLLEYELAEQRNNYVEKSEFEAEMQFMVAVVSDILKTTPNRLQDAGLSDDQIEYVSIIIENLCDAIYHS